MTDQEKAEHDERSRNIVATISTAEIVALSTNGDDTMITFRARLPWVRERFVGKLMLGEHIALGFDGNAMDVLVVRLSK